MGGKMKKYWALIGILVLAIGVAPAQGADFRSYVVGKLGSYSPSSGDLSGYSTGMNGEIGLGHYINPHLALELGVGYFETKGDVTVISGGVYFGNEKIEVTPLTMSLKACLPIDGWMEIYGIGGVGAYFVQDSINAFNSGLGNLRLDDNTTAFGTHLGGGINFNLSSNVFVGGEFKYVWSTAKLYGDNVSLDGVRVTGNLGFRF